MYNILICDDQPDIVNALKIYLAPEGYRLFEAFTGKQAIDLCRKEDIHLILLDIMMPEMDGITATAEIRRFSNAPIIFLTITSPSPLTLWRYWPGCAASSAVMPGWAAGWSGQIFCAWAPSRWTTRPR